MRGGTVWAKLKKRTDLCKIHVKTEGRLFKASVVASLLYGTEVRGISKKQIQRMQTFVNRCERRLYFGPMGGLREMKGNVTQQDIRVKLGTLSVQLEIDDRTLRYVGHICRFPEDRWESKVLRGLVEDSEREGTKTYGSDLWWDRIRKLVKDVMVDIPPGSKWEGRWRKLRYDWKQKRIAEERQDTQKAREENWNAAGDRCLTASFVEKVWDKVKPPNASGSPLEGVDENTLKHMIVAGGIQRDGWNARTPGNWKALCESESAKMWLQHHGTRAKRRIQKWKMEVICAFDISETWRQFSVTSGGALCLPCLLPRDTLQWDDVCRESNQIQDSAQLNRLRRPPALLYASVSVGNSRSRNLQLNLDLALFYRRMNWLNAKRAG